MLKNYFKTIFKSIVFVFVVCLLFYSYSSSIKAINLQPYFFPSNSPGNPMSSGEFFKTIPEGNGCYKIQKSRDAQYYEKFCTGADGKIYHVEDTTWATGDGNVTCSDTGNEAKLSYEGGQTPWANGSMSVGETFTSSGTVVGIDKVTGKQCPTPFGGAFTRSVKMITQGCVIFPDGNGSTDAIGLEIQSGPGAGEQFFYGAGQGWIGFNRGADETGAYAENLNSITSKEGCYQVKIATIGKNCPPGYTCPKTPNTTLKGEVINIVKHISKWANPRDALKGETGPKTGEFQSPNLSQESDFYFTQDFFQRSLTDTQQKQLRFNAKSMEGQLGHPGCGDVYVNGSSIGKAETDPKVTEFTTKPDYNTLLLTNEYWRCILINGYSCKLKFQTVQPEYSEPQTNTGECQGNTGESIDQEIIPNGPPQVIGFVGGVLNSLSNLLNGLYCAVVGGKEEGTCSVEVKFSLQQDKGIPAEATFDDQTVNKNGFLNWFQTDTSGQNLSYEKTNNLRDEDEKSNYKVVGDDRLLSSSDSVGTTFQGEADFQKETLNFYKSMYIENLAKDINSLGASTAEVVTPIGTTPTEITELLKIPYRDASITLTPEVKARVIARFKQMFPDSPIDQYWDQIASTATSRGINPAFALAIFMEESGGGSPSLAARLGIRSSFGCDPTRFQSIPESLDCFVKTTVNSPKEPNFEKWAENYCGRSIPGKAVCTMNEAGHDNSNFLRNVNYFYNFFAPTKVGGVN
jgi:hypothetical protein